MKTINFFVLGLIMASLAFAVGCGDNEGTYVPPVDTSSDTDTDTDTDADADGGDDSGDSDNEPTEVITDFDKSECDTTKTCSALTDATECIASFDLGTNQSGYKGAYPWVGFYSYTDMTKDGTIVPVPNFTLAEDAVGAESCDPENDWVMHLKGEGFTTWGAGVGMDWGGDENPNCVEEDNPGVEACLELMFTRPKFLLEDDIVKELCDTEEKLDCLKTGKFIKEPRNLNDYVGIGFWMVATEDNEATAIKVLFPVPDTTRFYGYCDDDAGETGMKCFDDFLGMVPIAIGDVGKWVYKEVLFVDLETGGWGLDLEDVPEKSLSSDTFTKADSMGVKFQIDSTTGTAFDIYFDDIHLIK